LNHTASGFVLMGVAGERRLTFTDRRLAAHLLKAVRRG
jgi:hypothetical protein